MFLIIIIIIQSDILRISITIAIMLVKVDELNWWRKLKIKELFLWEIVFSFWTLRQKPKQKVAR